MRRANSKATGSYSLDRAFLFANIRYLFHSRFVLYRTTFFNPFFHEDKNAIRDCICILNSAERNERQVKMLKKSELERKSMGTNWFSVIRTDTKIHFETSQTMTQNLNHGGKTISFYFEEMMKVRKFYLIKFLMRELGRHLRKDKILEARIALHYCTSDCRGGILNHV